MKVRIVEVAPPLTRLSELRPGELFKPWEHERFAMVLRNEPEASTPNRGVLIAFLDDGETMRWPSEDDVIRYPRAEFNPGLPG